jgi:ABC-type siderophore export system fused ATPase/permease subunit
MNLSTILHMRSKRFYISLALLSLISSFTNIGLLFIINITVGGIHTTFLGKNLYLGFIALVVISFMSTLYFQKNMTRLTNDIVFDMEMTIVNKIRKASFDSFEKLGREKIYTTLCDAWILGRVPETLVFMVNGLVSVICSIVYLFLISAIGAIVILFLLTILILFYLLNNKKIANNVREVRKIHNKYYASLNELLNGFKQIKISLSRDIDLFSQHIQLHRNNIRTMNVNIARKYAANQLFGTYSWYITIGVVIFLLPVFFNIKPPQTAAFITTILFMISPLGGLFSSFPFFNNVNNAVERIKEIDEMLVDEGGCNSMRVISKKLFNIIRFEDVVYKYTPDEENSFSIEFDNVEILANEILFLVGGNGSGKTTFLNILTGLYRPQSGKVFIDDKEISWDEFRSFSDRMAVIFADQHLFSQNYDNHDLTPDNTQLNILRSHVNLNGVIKINTNKNWFEKDLSRGQQKRLMLLLAIMENKEIIVLDEWAAEQDTYNRRSFYTKWVKELKAEGKTVIAITHDDDFFEKADRILKFSHGKVKSYSGEFIYDNSELISDEQG